jgi:hypothetical protein
MFMVTFAANGHYVSQGNAQAYSNTWSGLKLMTQTTAHPFQPDLHPSRLPKWNALFAFSLTCFRPAFRNPPKPI